MDTANLKLKFNLLSQSVKGSKSACCLEIVPEISCIENLDTLNWKNDSEVIEYTVPMTYKITLKKSALKEHNATSFNKVYYSCVDLLVSNSSFNNFGCGDMPRIMSDNLMISHFANQTLVRENKTRLGVREKYEDSELLSVFIEDARTSNQSVLSNKIECVFTETHHDNDTSTSLININKKCVRQETMITICSAGTNTKQDLNDDQDFEIIKNSSTETDNSNLKKLTLSPICSVSTDENDAKAPKVYDKNDLIETIIYPKPFQELHHDLLMDVHQFSVFDVVKKTKNEIVRSNNCMKGNKLSKEAKFEKFLRMMEKELRPVNMMLNDLINKCVSLGIHKNIVNTKQKAIDYNAPTNCKDKAENPTLNEFMCKSKSNRVVYNVIFDG